MSHKVLGKWAALRKSYRLRPFPALLHLVKAAHIALDLQGHMAMMADRDLEAGTLMV